MLIILIVTLYASILGIFTAGVLKHNESTQEPATATIPKQQQSNFKNTTHTINHASLYNIRGYQTPWWQPLLQLPSQPPSQLIVSGLVAGFGLFIGNVALDKYRRPKLVVDKGNSPKIVQIDLVVYKFDERQIPYHLRQFTVPYNVNRILISNQRSSAAKNCKGALTVDDLEHRVCWSIPADRNVVTVNAHSTEYLDLVVGLIGTQNEHSKLNETVTELLNYLDEGMIHNVTLYSFLKQQILEIKEGFKSPSDIPLVIAPTENDWSSK